MITSLITHLTLAISCVAVATDPVLFQGDAEVDVILEWNAVALNTNALDHGGAAEPAQDGSDTQGPPALAGALAMVHLAMFDAYNSVNHKFTPYLFHGVVAENDASADAAVAQAAHDVLLALIPEFADTYTKALSITLSRVSDQSKESTGIKIGRAAAEAILANRTTADAPFLNSGGAIYKPTGEIGIHDVDPVNPHQGFDSPDFGFMQPFGVDSVDDFRAPRPPAIDSKEYADALEEVKELGVFRGGRDGLEAPTSDETLVIANFWGYNGSPKSKYKACLYGPNLAIHFDPADILLISFMIRQSGHLLVCTIRLPG